MTEGLTRAEAAKYLGFQSVEGIRHLQKAGRLRAVRDKKGCFRFALEDLDKLKVERQRGGPAKRQGNQELSVQRQYDRLWAENEKWWAKRETEMAQLEVRRDEYRRAVEEFQARTLNTQTTRAALGDISASSFLDLLRRGLLREVQPPSCPQGVAVWDLRGGPFFDRAEVLALRREMLDQSAPMLSNVKGQTARLDASESVLPIVAGLVVAVAGAFLGSKWGKGVER